MKTYTLYDKTGWGKGPWQDEPDYVAFIEKETTYPCVAKRNMLGVFVGYVGLDEHHPLYLAEVGCAEFDFIDVHQHAPTFAALLPEECVNFAPPKMFWWVGFDCMHETDMCPWRDTKQLENPQRKPTVRRSRGSGIYRDLPYVTEQLELLASQLSTFDPRFT